MQIDGLKSELKYFSGSGECQKTRRSILGSDCKTVLRESLKRPETILKSIWSHHEESEAAKDEDCVL